MAGAALSFGDDAKGKRARTQASKPLSFHGRMARHLKFPCILHCY
jgi:hypothetical protein